MISFPCNVIWIQWLKNIYSNTLVHSFFRTSTEVRLKIIYSLLVKFDQKVARKEIRWIALGKGSDFDCFVKILFKPNSNSITKSNLEMFVLSKYIWVMAICYFSSYYLTNAQLSATTHDMLEAHNVSCIWTVFIPSKQSETLEHRPSLSSFIDLFHVNHPGEVSSYLMATYVI